MFALLITPIIWAFKKIMGRSQKDEVAYAKVHADKESLAQNQSDQQTSYAGAGGQKYEPMGSGNNTTTMMAPSPMVPSPMGSPDPSAAPAPIHPPQYAAGAAASYYAPPPVPPPAVTQQYYDPASR